jgi:hypothetical protein
MTLTARTLAAALAAFALCGPGGTLAPTAGRAQTVPSAYAAARPLRLSGLTVAPGQQCRRAIRAEERASGIPDNLMAAIGRVESGRREADGSVNPWPWSFNAEGEDHVFETKADAIAAVRALQAHGMRSIDVGCMQVNLMYHPDAFASLEEAFDPVANVHYAARFLLQLHAQTGAWPAAAAAYHSFTPELGADYQRKVMAVWPIEQQTKPDTLHENLVAAWAATLPGAQPGLRMGTAALSPGGPRLAGAGLTSGGMPLPRLLPLARAGTARIIPLADGQAGRGLDAYRARPIPLALPGRLPAAPADPAGNRHG